MAFRIEDGKGHGYAVEVTKDNRLRVYATTEMEASYESEVNEACFVWTFNYDHDAGDTIILLKNEDQKRNLLIEHVSIALDVSSLVTIHSPSCATPAGTAVTGVNLNRKSGRAAAVICKQDETSNSQGDILDVRYIKGGEHTYNFDVKGMYVLGYGDCVAIDVTTAGTRVNGHILGYFHEA